MSIVKSVLISAVVAAISSATCALAAQYYISPGGSDRNSGASIKAAWATLAPLSKVKSGDIVNFKAGGKWETNGGLKVDNATYRAYGSGPRPRINGKNIKFATIHLANNAVVDGLSVTADSLFGFYLLGKGSILRNCEVDGTGTRIQIGVGCMGPNNIITHNYVHDLGSDTGDTGNLNSSGGAEGIVIFGGKNIEVSYNAAVRCACKNKTLGGDEGGGIEIINPFGGTTIEDIRIHHNYVEDSVGLFEACTGTGTGREDPSKNPGTIKNVTVAYNVAVDSKWLYLLQTLNTHLKNVVFEHNTIIHTKRNQQIWSKDPMSHPDMIGMFFYADPFTGSKISDQVKPTDLIVRDNIFIDPFTKRPEGLWIGGGFAHYNNIFSPSKIPLGKYKLAATELKVDNVALNAGFRLTAKSPAIDKGSRKTNYKLDVDGHKVPAGSKPDIGASEYIPGNPFHTQWSGGAYKSITSNTK
jgi:hypothetical protein